MLPRRVRLLPILALAGWSVAAADIEGRVVAVVDGDTIRVQDAGQRQHKVRLVGIDAPERGQPFGGASRRHLAALVAGRAVRVETLKLDRYGRVLGKVWVQPPDCAACDKTLDANLAQVESGMAWWYRYYADDQPPPDRERYGAAVADAQRRGLGLWRDARPVPPWAWRRGTRTTPEPAAAPAFDCGSKHYCREMTDCEEARYYLRRCGQTSLDGDRDGVPCEPLCR